MVFVTSSKHTETIFIHVYIYHWTTLYNIWIKVIIIDHFIWLNVANDQMKECFRCTILIWPSEITYPCHHLFFPTYILGILREDHNSHLPFPMLRRTRSKSLEMETFADNLLTALEKDNVGDRLKPLLKSVVQEVMEPNTRRREQSLNIYGKRGVNREDATQSSRRQDRVIWEGGHPSQRHNRRPRATWPSRLSEIFRFPGEGDGSTDDKTLYNVCMKLRPPLSV